MVRLGLPDREIIQCCRVIGAARIGEVRHKQGVIVSCANTALECKRAIKWDSRSGDPVGIDTFACHGCAMRLNSLRMRSVVNGC